MTGGPPHGRHLRNWHQDNFAFGADVQADRAKQERIISLAVYLDDSDQENGCFQVVPGSHRYGFLPPPAFRVAEFGSAPAFGSTPAGGRGSLEDPLSVPCEAGTVVLFSANLLHSALPTVLSVARAAACSGTTCRETFNQKTSAQRSTPIARAVIQNRCVYPPFT